MGSGSVVYAIHSACSALLGLYLLRLRREPPAAPPPAPPGIKVARPPLGERARVPLGVQALFRVLTLPPRRVGSVKWDKRL